MTVDASPLSRRAVLQTSAATVFAASALGRAAGEDSAVAPFTFQAPQSALEDLRQRLARTRWPEREPVDDWSQGVPLAGMRSASHAPGRR